jgi:carbonic anhydrase/acetyltransferase-like protein (isoleucine patch superfamily)
VPKLITVRGKTPTIPDSCFIAEGSIIAGDVEAGENCSVWFNAVIRGDVCEIRLGSKVNVQDLCMIHGTINKSKTIIGDNVSIGHRAIIHGALIEDNVLIGMGAIVMDNAVVGTNSIVAAGAVVLENQIVEPNSVYAGIPAKKIKDLSPELQQFHINRTANAYVKYAEWYRKASG